jgi:hypothetical protein
MNRIALCVLVVMCASFSAHAEGARVLDGRYHHDRYYPPRGGEVAVIPRAAVSVRYGRDPYYFHEGVWYRPHGRRFVVVAPPFGLFVPVLPPFYTTVWFGGLPYYYANDVYYARQGDGYVVTAPPGEAATSPPPSGSTTPASDEPFIYPKNGQSEQQQATDKYECHAWAAKESAYDPTLPGNAAPSEAAAKRSNYFRAIGACLEGRGYTTR